MEKKEGASEPVVELVPEQRQLAFSVHYFSPEDNQTLLVGRHISNLSNWRFTDQCHSIAPDWLLLVIRMLLL